MSIQGLSPFFNQVMGFVSIFIRLAVFFFVVSSIRYWLLLVKASKMAIINKKKTCIGEDVEKSECFHTAVGMPNGATGMAQPPWVCIQKN